MKKIFLLAMSLLSISSFAQTTDSIAIEVVYPKNQAGQGAAILVDGKLISAYYMTTLDPHLIRNVNIEKKDTTISGRTYKGIARLTMKSEYDPSLITLADLKKKYTSLKPGPTIYMINDQMISGSQDDLLMDEKRIVKIIVDQVNAGDNGSDIQVVKVVTKPVEKIKKPE